MAARSSFSEELREELDALQRENREVNAAHAELTAEADELRQQVEQLNATVEQTGDEAKKLRSQLRDAEVRAEDLSIDLESAQQQLDSREDQLKQMRKQMEENKTQNQNQPLLDELDILREKLVNAQKNEVLLTKAKKRLEELSDLPSQIQSLEEQNAVLVKEAHVAAGSSSKANAKQQEITALNA